MGLGSARFCLALSPWTTPVGARAAKQRLPVRLLLTLGSNDLEMFREAAPLYEQDFAHALRYEHDGEHVYPLVSERLRMLCLELVRGGEHDAPNQESDGPAAIMPIDGAVAPAGEALSARAAALVRLTPSSIRELLWTWHAWVYVNGFFILAFGLFATLTSILSIASIRIW